MRVTVKAVNAELARLGVKAELAQGAGYFFFRGGEADDWIDRTISVPTIGSLTLEQWLHEYQRLKGVNDDMMKAATQAPPIAAKAPKQRREAPVRESRAHESPSRESRAPTPGHEAPIQAPTRQEAPARDATRKEACTEKTKLLADLDQLHKGLAAIAEQQVSAAREGRISDLVTLSATANRERSKFDRALHAIRDHTLVHGC